MANEKLRELIAKWREKGERYRHFDPLTSNRGDGIKWCADELEALLAVPAAGEPPAFGSQVEDFAGLSEEEVKRAMKIDTPTPTNDAELSQGTPNCDICGLDTPHHHGAELVEIERFTRPAFEKTKVPCNTFGRIAKKPEFPYSDNRTEGLWQHFKSGWFACKSALAWMPENHEYNRFIIAEKQFAMPSYERGVDKFLEPPVEGKQEEASWRKHIAEDWLNEHKRVWSGYDLHTLIRMLDEACTQAKDITEYDRDKLWCDTLFNDNAKEGSPVVFCGPESGKKIFDNLLTARAQSRASVLEPDVIETIINVLNNDFTNATDNFLRGQMQQQRMPYDHDNNRAQERRAAWQAKTRKAIAAIRALADAPATGKEGGSQP